MDIQFRWITTAFEREAVHELARSVDAEMGRAGSSVDGPVLAAFGPTGAVEGAALVRRGSDGYAVELTDLVEPDQVGDIVGPEHTWIVRQVLLGRRARLGSLPLDLFAAVRRHAAEQGIPLVYALAEPYLVPLYQRLGFRAVGDGSHLGALGFVVPQALVVWDVAHLRDIRSPLAPGNTETPTEDDETIARALAARLDGDEEEIDTRELWEQAWAATQTQQGEAALFADLTPQQIKLYMAQCEEVGADAGETLVARGDDTERRLYIVIEGLAEARTGDRRLGLLPKGSVFGEIGYLLQVPRTADVVALEDGTRVVAMSERHVDAIAKIDPGLAYLVMRNLGRVLCARLIATQ